MFDQLFAATVSRLRKGALPRTSPTAIRNRLLSVTEDEARRIVTTYEPAAIKGAFSDDKWNANYFLNLRECETKADILETYPWNVALPIADVCNARCTFCTSWLEGTAVLQPEQLKPFMEVLPYARLIGFQGHGEPLANPHIESILQQVGDVVDSRAVGYIITNGIYLRKHIDQLLRARVQVFNLSLNAVSEETHDVVMGLGRKKIYDILSTVAELVRMRDNGHPEIQVTISMVLTADNIHEAADFVALGNELRVTTIYLRTLFPVGGDNVEAYKGLNYHLLSPSLHPMYVEHAKRALDAVAASAVKVETNPSTWAQDSISASLRKQVTANPPLFYRRQDALRDKEIRRQHAEYPQNDRGRGRLLSETDDLVDNPYNRAAPFDCRFIYQNIIATKLTLEMFPCCYMSVVPGHERVVIDDSQGFMEFWNSPAFVTLRRRLANGPLFQACATCPAQG